MYASLEVWMVSHAFGSLSRLKETPCVRWTSGVKGTGERGGLAAMALDLVGVRVRVRARARARARARVRVRVRVGVGVRVRVSATGCSR